MSERKSNKPKHYILYKSNGIQNKMLFYSDTNVYVGTLTKDRDRFILNIIDTLHNKEYKLMTETPIYIKGGDIKIKK